MKFILILLIGIAVSAGTIFVYNAYQAEELLELEEIVSSDPPTPTPSPFDPKIPPSESLIGEIEKYSGTLFIEERMATEPAKLQKDTQTVLQGERLITEDKSSAVIDFINEYTFQIGEGSDISFIQTLPIDFVVEQKTGTVDYMVSSATPLSIRIRSALIAKDSGTIKITMIEGDSIVRIESLAGPTKIGFNDLDLKSQVFDLREGQVYEFNSDERTTINVSK